MTSNDSKLTRIWFERGNDLSLKKRNQECVSVFNKIQICDDNVTFTLYKVHHPTELGVSGSKPGVAMTRGNYQFIPFKRISVAAVFLFL